MSAPLHGTVIELIEARRRADVVELIRSTARSAGLPDAVGLLATAQVEVGLRWQTNRWPVAEEHAATAIVDLALTAAALDVQQATPPRGTIVVACVEEEWHVLPARMLAELLRATGWDVIFLGASTPADHLARFLLDTRPAAVCLSCSVPIFLPGAARSIAACHTTGTPVLAGGPGFGVTSRRAAALGADAWAVTAAEATQVLATWMTSPPQLATARVDAHAQLALAAERPRLVDAAMRALIDRDAPTAQGSPQVLARPELLEHVREDLDVTLRFVEAALRTGDDAIVVEFAGWRSSVLTSRALPPEVVAASTRALRECVGSTFTDARRLLTIAAHTDATR